MKRLWKRKIGRTMAAALSLTALLGLTACGSGAEKSAGDDGAGAVSAVEEQMEAAAEAGEGEEAAAPAADAGKDGSQQDNDRQSKSQENPHQVPAVESHPST